MPSSWIATAGSAIWARRGFWARFQPAAERAFSRHYDADLVQRARWSALIAASVMAVYSLLDIFMIPREVMPHFLWIRWSFMILPLLGVYWLSYRPCAPRHLQKVAAGVSVSSGLAVVAMIVLARMNGTPIEYEGIILTVFYFYCCGGLRMRWGILAGMSGMIAYGIAEAWAGLGTHELVVRMIFLASANVVGVISAALMELAARRNFAQLMALEALSNQDPLTGLHNRRSLQGRIPRLIEDAIAQGHRLHFAMMDIDFFKQYNDEQGHALGDAALRAVADLLARHATGPHDIVARFGGEEFLCIWSVPADQTLERRMSSLLAAVQAMALPHPGSPHGILTLSLGALDIAAEDLRHDSDCDSEVLRQADELLYRAKRQGRAQGVLASGLQGPSLPRTLCTVKAPLVG